MIVRVPLRGMVRAAVIMVLCLGLAAPARAVDVSNLSDFEADPCVMALSDRNTAQHVDAPDSALADACERAHGSVEVAWDFLTRTWLPPDVARSVSGMAAAPITPLAAALAVLEMVLIYGVLGVPVWALVVALRSTSRAPLRPGWVAGEIGLCVVLRLLLGTALLALLTVPAAKLLAALALLVLLATGVRARPRPQAGLDDGPASAFAVLLAGAINDTAAAVPGVLALALVARGQWRLLALGVLLSLLASLPQVARVRRSVLLTPSVLASGAALLALGVGALALTDRVLAGAAAQGGLALAVAIPLVFAAVVVWRSQVLERMRRPRLSGG